MSELLKILNPTSNFAAKEYLHVEGQSDLYQNMDDKVLLNSVQNNVEHDDLNQTLIEPKTLVQAKLALETLKTSIFQSINYNQHDINCLQYFTAKLKECNKNSKQKTLDK